MAALESPSGLTVNGEGWSLVCFSLNPKWSLWICLSNTAIFFKDDFQMLYSTGSGIFTLVRLGSFTGFSPSEGGLRESLSSGYQQGTHIKEWCPFHCSQKESRLTLPKQKFWLVILNETHMVNHFESPKFPPHAGWLVEKTYLYW